jgi:condensin complex subunit 1
MFGCLKDEDFSVRKSSLMVLSHLVLNDMLKVKNDITEIALCITDDQQNISDAAKHFFVELSKKGNNSSTIYNLLPSTINQLIQDANVNFKTLFLF